MKERRSPNDRRTRNGGQSPQQAETSRPVLWGLTGGCARGYQLAGFHVTGIDNRPQPRYAGDAFVQADALEYIREHGTEFDAIHASPPCQGYSRMRHLPWLSGKKYPLLLDPTRELMVASGRPWVIENVADAPLKGVMLCGTMFSLKCFRHRLFETSFFCWQPAHRKHRNVIGKGALLDSRRAIGTDGFVSVIGKARREIVEAAKMALGLEWMHSPEEVSQAIPPAYCEWLGRHLMTHLERRPMEAPAS